MEPFTRGAVTGILVVAWLLSLMWASAASEDWKWADRIAAVIAASASTYFIVSINQ